MQTETLTENVEQYRVLILDDDYELGDLLREYLQNTRQCSVTFVTNEADFWDCFENHAYDILFLDYKLPTTNGIEILTRMSHLPRSIPTVMMTGEGSENIAARAMQAGALDYLVKGEYAFTTLPGLIQKAVRQRETQKAMQAYLEQIRYQAMLLDAMRDAVVVWDSQGIITYWNTAAEQLYGASGQERLGKTIDAVYLAFFEAADPGFAAQPTDSTQVEHQYRLPNGDLIWVSNHIAPLFSGDPLLQRTGTMSVARNITPRKSEHEALVQSENFVKHILDTSPNVIYLLDLNTMTFLYVNSEIQVMLGFSPEELTGSPFKIFTARIHPDDLSNVAHHLHELQAIHNSVVLEAEYRFLSRDNQWHWLNSRETIFSRSLAGIPNVIIGVIEDITRNKQSEEKLQHRLNSEILLSTVSNNLINLPRAEADQGVATAMQMVSRFIQVDASVIARLVDGQLITVSRYAADAEPDSLFMHPNLNLQDHPSTWLLKRLQNQETVVISRGDDLPAEAAYDRALLQSMGLRSAIMIPMVSNNEFVGLLGFGATQREMHWSEEDIYTLKTFTEIITSTLLQKEGDQALRKSEARYRAIVEDHQTEMICRFRSDASLTFVNEAYCRYYGVNREALSTASFLDPILEQDRSSVREVLAGLNTDANVKVFTQRVKLGNGETRWQEWVSRAIFDQHNDFIEFQAVGRDITERKQLEDQIKAAQNHLTQAARLASIGELASSVAHQISNPLTTIIADAQILAHTLGSQHPASDSAQAIVQAGWRAQAVITELMKFSQPAQKDFAPVAINDTIQTALLLVSAHIQSLGVQIHTDLQARLPQITGSDRQLADVWVNLLLLARQSFVEGGDHHITIRSFTPDAHTLRVEFHDNGTPIPPEKFDTLFEPQLIPTGSGRGTGMELSLCREIIRQHHGQIRVSGSHNETIFIIEFSEEGQHLWIR